MQFCPMASVLPQGLLLGVRLKSPLVAMLLIFNVAVPVLARVTLFPALVFPKTRLPNISDVGVRVTTGLLPVFTVSWIVVA